MFDPTEWRRHVDAYRKFYAMQRSERIAQDYWQVGASLKGMPIDGDRYAALTVLYYVLMELVLEREIPV